MPPIEIGPTRAVGAVDARIAKTAFRTTADKTGASNEAPAVVVESEALDAQQPPVNAERVAEIRKAIDEGKYPVLPMRVADAIIAAGLLLRSGK